MINFYMPVEDGTYYGITHGEWAASSSLSRAYPQNYTIYGYEILLVDRSHQGGVQCTWTLSIACLIFELLLFVYFQTWILSGAYLQYYTSWGHEILWVDRSHQGRVHCTWTLTLAC